MSSVTCRMCGEATETGVSLLDPANKKLAQCVISKFRYQITVNSRFSKHICGECADNLQVWMYFLERCKKSQTLFADLVEAEKSQTGQNVSSVKVEKSQESLESSSEPAISAESPRELAQNFADPLLSASELEITAKFPQLKVAVVRLDKDDIEVRRHQQSDITSQHKEAESSMNFSCHLCKYKSRLLSSLQTHVTQFHHLRKEELTKHFPNLQSRQYETLSKLKIHLGCHTSPFQCDICQKSFVLKSLLTSHKLTHSELQHCHNKFKQTQQLKHRTKIHHNLNIYECDHCKDKFKTKIKLRKHISNTHTVDKKLLWKCEECKKCFETRYNLQKHERNSHVEAIHSCSFCNLKFKLKSQLIVHITTKHGVHKCDWCPAHFETKCQQMRHINCVHTDQLEWKCDQCEKCFLLKKYLQAHKYKVHGEAEHCCPKCERMFKGKGNMKRHIKIHHSRIKEGHRMEWKCDQCDKCFLIKEYLQRHKYTVHAVAKHCCPKCKRMFKVITSLKRHTKICHSHIKEGHRVEFKCDQCDKCFLLKKYLRCHKSRVHCVAKHCCPKCARMFKESGNLKKHIGICQTKNVANYQCDQCKLKFKTKFEIVEHIRVGHRVEWKCDQCDQCFLLKEYLQAHKREVHAVAKHCCPKCKRMFEEKDNMEKHIERCRSGDVVNYKCDQIDLRCNLSRDVTSKVSTTLPWKCDECGKCFKIRDYLRSHKKQDHKN